MYGTICLDQFVRVGADGGPVTDTFEEMPGGEAFNTATALAGWGVNVLLTGTAFGGDAESDRLRHLLDTHPLGLPRDFVPDLPHAVTPVCTISVAPNGERRMQGRGYAQAVAPPPLPDVILQTRPLYVCDPNLGPPAVVAAQRAAGFGCPILAMDFAPASEIIAFCRLAVTSREMLAKQRIGGASLQIARDFVTRGAQTAIVTNGAEGCVVADRDAGEFPQSAFPVTDPVDTTGAGDTFRAGLAYGLLRQLSLRETVRFAAAAAALHCQILGGGSRIPLDVVRRKMR